VQKLTLKKAKELNVTKTVVNNWSMKFLITASSHALKLKITSVPINQLQYSAKTLHLHQKLLHINYKTAKMIKYFVNTITTSAAINMLLMPYF